MGYLDRAIQRVQARGKDTRDLVLAWSEIHLFAEMFYFVAWRLLVVMRSTGDLAWPGLPSPDAPGVTLVRNHLIEHPEKHGRLFDRSATLIKDGPVLKSARMVIDPETGEAVSAPENVDRGLYVNARELHAALVQCLTPSTSGN